MKKIVNKLIDESVKGVDTYTHNGSTWLIFTESKQWVIELTESKTLWYNYNFFNGMFAYASMDVVDNQHYITQWVEDNIINKVKDTILEQNITEGEVEGIIEMAVKENSFSFVRMKVDSYNVIKNGVKETNKSLRIDGSLVIEDTIENGVKKTGPIQHKYMVEDIIENGVKETKSPGANGDLLSTIEWMEENNSSSYTKMIDDVIESGIKEIRPSGCVDPKTGIFHYRIQEQVDDVVDNGVKEVQPLPDQSGELIGYSNYYRSKENRTKPFIDYLEETIKFGVKENIG
jgi:hypothetical protein